MNNLFSNLKFVIGRACRQAGKLVIGILLVIGIWSLVIAPSGAFASQSASYAISAEVIDLGGASMESSSYNMFGKLREKRPELTTSSSYTLEGRFLGIVYGSGTISTLETPVVTAVIPNSGLNNNSYEVVINGYNISTDATAALIKSGQTDINGTDISIASSVSMEATFDITGAQAGTWNVIVTNTGYGRSSSPTVASRFTVASPGPVKIIGIPVNEPNPFNPSDGSTEIKYTLSTNATIALYLFNQKGELIWQKTFSSGENGGRAGANDPTWDGITAFNENVPTGVYILRIISKSGGIRELGKIKIAVLRQ